MCGLSETVLVEGGYCVCVQVRMGRGRGFIDTTSISSPLPKHPKGQEQRHRVAASLPRSRHLTQERVTATSWHLRNDLPAITCYETPALALLLHSSYIFSMLPPSYIPTHSHDNVLWRVSTQASKRPGTALLAVPCVTIFDAGPIKEGQNIRAIADNKRWPELMLELDGDCLPYKPDRACTRQCHLLRAPARRHRRSNSFSRLPCHSLGHNSCNRTV